MADPWAGERWLPVVGWNGFYEVSNLGRIRSVPRWSEKARRFYGGGLISTTGDRYETFAPMAGDSRSRMPVHVAVLEAFVGPRPEGMVCRHLNGDPFDNRASNLAWGTHAENMDDQRAHGTLVRGERVATARLTAQEVEWIRAEAEAGDVSVRSIARKYGMCLSQVQRIVRRKSWRHL